DLEALVLAQLGRRQHADLDRELECLALRRQLAEVQLWVAHGDDARGGDGIGIPAPEAIADSLLQHGLTTDLLEHQWRRDLAAAEAGKLQLASELACLALDSALDLFRGY